jgi:hypothetical protein
VPDATLQGVDVALVIGRDYTGVAAAGATTPTSAAATSTVPTTTTTVKAPQPALDSRGAPIPLPECP